MTLRRSLLAAAAGLVVSGTGAVAGPVTPAAAAPTHVAIVVAGVGTACVPAGASGLQMLTSAFTVEIGQSGPTAGMVLKINGVGSYSVNPDYWSYWHGSGSGWAYSSVGPASYHPAAGSVEGWAFGAFKAGDRPPLGTPDYASLCGARDPKPRTTSAAPPSTPRATRHSAQPVVPAPTSSTAVTSSTAPRPHRHGTSPAGHPTRSRAAVAATSISVAAPTLTFTPASHVAKGGTSALPTVGTGLAFVVVAALGGAAYWRSRSRGSA